MWQSDQGIQLQTQSTEAWFFFFYFKVARNFSTVTKFVSFQQKVDVKRKTVFKPMIKGCDKLHETHIISFWHLRDDCNAPIKCRSPINDVIQICTFVYLLSIYSVTVILCVDRHNEDYQVTVWLLQPTTPDKILIKHYCEKLLVNLQRICLDGFGWSCLAVSYHSSLGMYTHKALVTLVIIKYLSRRVTILDSLSIIWLLDLLRSCIKSYYYKFELQEYFLYTCQQYAHYIYNLYNFQTYFLL